MDLEDRETGDLLIVRHKTPAMGDFPLPAIAVNCGSGLVRSQILSSVAMVFPPCPANFYFPSAVREIARFRVPERRTEALRNVLVEIAVSGSGVAA